MTAQPRRVSVIIGTRDRPALLREALASIRALEGPDLTFEILVGDNGSDPDTPRAVAEFGGVYDKTDKNGCPAARNLALRRVTGEFIAFLDDDDLWLPGHIRPHIAFLDANPEYEAVFGQIVSTNAERKPLSQPWPSELPSDGKMFERMMSGYFPQVGGTVVRARALASHGFMDETLLGDSDWDWQLRIARAHNIGFVRVPCVLFRQRPDGSFDELQLRRLGFTRRIFLRHALTSRKLSAKTLYKSHNLAVWQFYEYFVKQAVRRVEVGEHAGARRAAVAAFRVLPIYAAKQLLSPTPLRAAFFSSLRIAARLKPRNTP